MNRISICLLFFLLSSNSVDAQEAQRPKIWGIAKMTFLVSDFQLARDYFSNFLGFDEAFSYTSDLGKVISFKISDRQFLEFVQDKQAKEKKRLVSVSLDTENVEQMRRYLHTNSIKVPDKTRVDGAGNEVFVVDDPSGNHIEFIDLKANGLHKKTEGKFLSDRRISKRIHHAGLYTYNIMDNDPFYAGALKCLEIARYPEDLNIIPTILYLGFGDCLENIEHYSPNDENISHPCFLVDDMQETIYTLKERKENETLGKPIIGKGKRWIMNMYNADNTRIEFTEAHCVK